MTTESQVREAIRSAMFLWKEAGGIYSQRGLERLRVELERHLLPLLEEKPVNPLCPVHANPAEAISSGCLCAPAQPPEPVSEAARNVVAQLCTNESWDEGGGYNWDEREVEVIIQTAISAETSRLREALERIERWFGEFPASRRMWDDGSPMSYGAAFGSNGERDFMREVARKALRRGE